MFFKVVIKDDTTTPSTLVNHEIQFTLCLIKIFRFQAKEEFSSTAEIVQTIQTMTANLAKVHILY